MTNSAARPLRSVIGCDGLNKARVIVLDVVDAGLMGQQVISSGRVRCQGHRPPAGSLGRHARDVLRSGWVGCRPTPDASGAGDVPPNPALLLPHMCCAYRALWLVWRIALRPDGLKGPLNQYCCSVAVPTGGREAPGLDRLRATIRGIEPAPLGRAF